MNILMMGCNRGGTLLLRLLGPALCATVLSVQAQPANFQLPAADERVTERQYLFEDTGEELPYALYVSSKIQPGAQAPLIVALHGLGGSHISLLRNNAIDLAEERGYILVGPMGYNSRGWYGAPFVPRPAPEGAPAGGPGMPQNNDPPNLRELSEKDVMNVLALVRGEYNIDDSRIYVMGHSMGGAGALHIGVKYADIFAGIASIAPAAFSMDPQSIATVPQMPVFLIHGLKDDVVPVAVSQPWAKVMADTGMTHVYLEPPEADHGNVIPLAWPGIFDFFDAHSR